jgi:single-strand DNA-binding protein
MLEMNKVMLIGNLTRDPELSYIANGTALAKLGLAVNRRFKDKSGQYQDETAFVDLDAWGATAEFCSKYLKKGRRVYVEGRLRFHSWEAQDGSKRSKLSVTADRIQFADAKPADAQGGEQSYQDAPAASQAPPPAQAPPPSDPGPSDESTADDLPF